MRSIRSAESMDGMTYNNECLAMAGGRRHVAGLGACTRKWLPER